MDKKAVIGLVLIALVLVVNSLLNRPSQEEIDAQLASRDSIQQVEEARNQARLEAAAAQAADSTEVSADTLAQDSAYNQFKDRQLREKYGVFAAAKNGRENNLTISTEKFQVTFSNKGGQVSKLVLTEYTSYDSLPLVLIDPAHSKFGLKFEYPSLGSFNTSDFYFTTSAKSKDLKGDETAQVVYSLEVSPGRQIDYIYSFTGNTYEVGFDVRISDLGNVMQKPALVWEQSSRHNEKGLQAERNNSTIFYKVFDEGRDYLSETSDDEETLEKKLQWIAFKQDFFSAILIGPNSFGENAELKSKPYPEETDSLVQYYYAEMPLAVNGTDNAAANFKFFYGPNDYRLLKTYDMEIDKVINLGWGIFGWVNKFIVIPIFDWLETTGMSYGIIILILTLIIKIALSPLTFKNYMSSAKMRVLKPEIDELNEKHKNADAMKKQQATMELYRKTGVNPMAGCVPMLLQIPILYAMFRFFPSSIQLRHESFLWADDLSSYDSIASLPFNIPFYGDHVSLFTILMCISTLLYTVYNSTQMPTQQQPGMPNMKVMMYIFPFFMLFIFNNLSAGLSYYYFLANTITLLQMVVIKNFLIDEDKIRAKIAENKKKPKASKSRFQRKLEEMAKQRGIQP